jgi:hypothetical protein
MMAGTPPCQFIVVRISLRGFSGRSSVKTWKWSFWILSGHMNNTRDIEPDHFYHFSPGKNMQGSPPCHL